uniref:Uncharacterized protein n=1 Tax=Parascaris equorum TaxID=6256 RepID=A0A914S288_PAREQ
VVYTPEYDRHVKTNGTKLARTITRANNFTLSDDAEHLSDNAWIRNGEDISEVYYVPEKFDLGISEILSSCGFAVFEKIGLKKYIGAFATNLVPALTDAFGIDNNPSYVPGMISTMD